MGDEYGQKNGSYDILEQLCLQAYESLERPGWCPTTFDKILCWLPTPPNTTASQPCMEQLQGISYDTSRNATKLCLLDGTWNITSYVDCKEKILPEVTDAPTVEITTYIYAIGYSVSLVALSLALFIFIYFKDLRCLRNRIHTNLMTTYILTDLMWILSLSMTIHTNSFFCHILFTLLHYFTLTNFFWMFVEGLYLYMLVVETFTRENIKLKAYLLIGWGSPVLVIFIWIIARSNVNDPTPSGPEVSKHCTWLNESWTDWICHLPAVIVLLINILFLFRIMWVLITKLRSANNVETEQYKKGCKALFVLIPLLGITYILFISGPKSSIYSHIRAILLSTQGLFVGMLYCFLNTEVQNTLKHRWLRWREERSLATRPYAKDSSPNTRTESIRLYSRHEITPYRGKRESTGSECTTMTFVHGCSRPSNGPRSPFLQPPSEPV